MSIFLGMLEDSSGREYEYGHCYRDDEDGTETGCGMEYAYYADTSRLYYWHDSVGLVSTPKNLTASERDALDKEHETCHERN